MTGAQNKTPKLTESHPLYKEFAALINDGKISKSFGAARTRRLFPELQVARYNEDRFRILFNRQKPMMDFCKLKTLSISIYVLLFEKYSDHSRYVFILSYFRT